MENRTLAPATDEVAGQRPALDPATAGDQVGQLGDGRHEVGDGHRHHGEVDQVGEDRQPRAWWCSATA